MNAFINNPVELIKTLDALLDHEVSLVVYGRGALCLGFEHPRAEFLNTQDVDFLIHHDHITEAQMEPAFTTVRIPDLQELRDAFQRALPVVRQLVASHH